LQVAAELNILCLCLQLMNKVLTVAVNCIIWKRHASPVGILSLLVCLAGGFFYEQAPLRVEAIDSEPGSASSTVCPELANSKEELAPLSSS
jgi:hypothetical protein